MNAQTKITVEGQVLDKKCNPIENAIVHAWYAGGNPGKLIFFRKISFNEILICLSWI